MSEYGKLIGNNAVRFERLLPGPIERVWEYLTDSEKRGTWFAAGPMEPRVDGKLELVFDNSNLGPGHTEPPERFKQYGGIHRSHHTVTRYEPPHALAITWDGGEDGGPSEVLFELAKKDADVLLTVTHRRIGSRDVLRDVSGGWHTHLDILADRLNGRTPQPFWTRFEKIEAAYDKRFGKK